MPTQLSPSAQPPLHHVWGGSGSAASVLLVADDPVNTCVMSGVATCVVVTSDDGDDSSVEGVLTQLSKSFLKLYPQQSSLRRYRFSSFV